MNSPPTFRDHMPVLDTLRGLAALLVVFTHVPSSVLGPTGDVVQGVLRPGYVAIEIFFVLSGFLITRLLLWDRAHGRSIKNYLIRRVLRIFPIYYVFLGVMLFLYPPAEIRWCAIYISNFYYPFQDTGSHLRHTWSLCVEEHYYLIWAVAVYGLGLATTRWLARYGFALVALVTSVVVMTKMEVGEAKRFLYMGSMFRMWSLALGSALAFSEHRVRENPRKFLKLAVGLFLLGQLLVQVFVVKWGVAKISLPLAMKINAWPGVWVVRLFAFPLISAGIVLACICLRDAGGWLGRGLRFGPLQYMGKVSYGWYLFHVPLFAHVFEEWGESPATLGVAAVLSVLVATVCFYAIEKPILRLKSRFGGSS